MQESGNIISLSANTSDFCFLSNLEVIQSYLLNGDNNYLTGCSITESILGSLEMQGGNYTPFFLHHLQSVLSVTISISGLCLSSFSPGSCFHSVLHCSCSLLLPVNSSPQFLLLHKLLLSDNQLITFLHLCITMGALTTGIWESRRKFLSTAVMA